MVTIDRSTGRITHIWNSLCSDRHRLIVPRSLLRQRFRDLGPRGRGHRTRQRCDPGRHRQRHPALQRRDQLGRQRAGAFVGREPADAQLDAGKPGAAERQRRRPRQYRTGAAAADVRLPACRAGRESRRPRPAQPEPARRYDRGRGAAAGWAAATDPGSGWGDSCSRHRPSGPHAGQTYVFVADDSGTSGFVLSGGRNPRLHVAAQNATPGTSPIVAGGLLYVYDDVDGELKVYEPTHLRLLDSLPAATGHWNSPIVIGGRYRVAGGKRERSRRQRDAGHLSPARTLSAPARSQPTPVAAPAARRPRPGVGTSAGSASENVLPFPARCRPRSGPPWAVAIS